MRTARVAIDPAWRRWRAKLTVAELSRLEAMRDENAARQSACAWLAVKVLAGRAVEILHGDDGRPRLADAETVVGIAHKPGYAFAALAEEPLGIDVEDLTQSLRLEAFLAGITAPGELSVQEAGAGLGFDPRQTAIVFWSLKEAACKWAGRPLVPRSCRVRRLGPDGGAALDFIDGARAPELRWRVVDGHVYTVAATGIGEWRFETVELAGM